MENRWNGLPLVIFGTSGHAREILCIVEEINKLHVENVFDFLGFVSKDDNDIGSEIFGYNIISSDNGFAYLVEKYDVLGVVVSQSNVGIKKKIVKRLKSYSNVVFPNIISPNANIYDSGNIIIGIGNIIASNVVMTNDIKIDNFNMINLSVTIGHNVVIGSYNTINPLTSISGDVRIDNNVLIGASSSVMQGIHIEDDVKIGLGAFVIKNVGAGSVMICKAAQEKEK